MFFHENNPIKLKINLETFETTEDIFSEGSHISQNGLFLLEAEGKIKIFRESDFSEPIYEFQIESYGDTAYEFASWSPNGNYVMFLANNSSGRATYVIYNVKGERITSFSVNKDRGKVCWCADGEGLVLCDYRNTEQKYYVFDIKTNTKEEVPCDQNTFFVDRYFSLTYEQNQWKILLQSKEKAQGTRIFLPFKSNNELQAIYNNQSGLCLILSPGKKVLLYCVNIES